MIQRILVLAFLAFGCTSGGDLAPADTTEQADFSMDADLHAEAEGAPEALSLL